nr:RNA-directed DNA polymerase, eukaryota, reverse transcriptase zinc-binding domain protein [Tanacetum cinerariifolium]
MKSLNEINSLETIEAAQKSKVRWAIKGDENTKYFQGILNNKRSQLSIRGVFVDGEWITDLVQDCGENKSLGPDGYTFEFFRSDVQSDGPFILNELISWCKIKKYKAMLFKVDFEKACDSASFCRDWNDSNLSTIAHVLKCFFLASGLKINMSKSKLMGIGLGTGSWKEQQTLSQPWDDVIHKISSRLSRWKVKNLSIGDLISFCIKKVGNGVDTLFWKDVWMGDLSLKFHFLRLYALETYKNISITMKLSFDSVASSFWRVLRGGVESEKYEDLVVGYPVSGFSFAQRMVTLAFESSSM